jgi:hypothetical protein
MEKNMERASLWDLAYEPPPRWRKQTDFPGPAFDVIVVALTVVLGVANLWH